MKRYARLAVQGGRTSYAELVDAGAALLDRAPWLGGAPTGERLAPFDLASPAPHLLLSPVEPRTILCVGRNYRAHAQELGNEVPAEPMLFYKPVTSLLDPGEALELPPSSITSRVDHEAELAVVVGARLRRATPSEARAAIFGLTVACDVTARDLQKKDGQWWRAKGFDGFCPVAPVVVSGVDPSDLSIRCWVGDEERQSGRTRDMIFAIEAVLSHISQAITLHPGDLVLTGTPEGVGPLSAGCHVAIEIEQVGRLDFDVIGAPAPR